MKNIKKISKEIIALALEQLVLERTEINSIYKLLNEISKLSISRKYTPAEIEKLSKQIDYVKNQARNVNKIFFQ